MSVRSAALDRLAVQVRLPVWVWLSVVRVGLTLSLCDSVVAVQDLSASPVCESEVCAQARTSQEIGPNCEQHELAYMRGA